MPETITFEKKDWLELENSWNEFKEFLKELKLTEGRGTGIPTIVNALKENGSPIPIFDINDPERTHFVVEIPIIRISSFVKPKDTLETCRYSYKLCVFLRVLEKLTETKMHR